MPAIPRRVVTGHDARGSSVFTFDDPVPAASTAPSGSLFYELWATDATPAPIGTDPVGAVPARSGRYRPTPRQAPCQCRPRR